MSVRPEDCEEVSWHSRQKHKFVQEYLSIWTQSVGRRAPSGPPSLEIVDLFAAFGWCRAREPTAPKEPWPGTAVLAAQALTKYGNPKRLFLNTWDPRGGDFHRRQADALRAAVKAACGPRPRFTLNIHEKPLEQALDEAEKVVDFRYPTLWLLDPYAPDQLPWRTVDRIAGHVHRYEVRGKPQTRRPEMIISLMTHAMQRNIDLAPDLITAALGLPEEVWRPRINELRAEGMNTREALVSVYGGRLRELYNNEPVVIEVEGVDGNIVYEVVFCTTHPAGKWMTLVNGLPKYTDWKQAEWGPRALLISQNRRILRAEGANAPIQKGIFDFRSEDEP